VTGSSPPTGDGQAPFILALGSNLGDRRARLEQGIHFLSERLRLCAVSRLVESPPWGPVARQGDFFNVLVRGSTALGPLELLEVLQQAEAAAGRRRFEPQGPRTLDVDLVFYGTLRIEHPRLVVPHPRWRERPFVADLLPDVAGSMIDPATGRPLSETVSPGGLSPGLREVAGIDAGFPAVEGSRC
jgi:2-amino-4-hydroxy-6-hydroxymethyldihydropteridine diphosphokinase